MSLARAFTTKRSRGASDTSAPLPMRSLTTKYSFPPGTIRNKISAPIELISTTNMLSYNAPDIFPKSSPSTSSRSSNSDDDSDRSPTNLSSPTTSTDSSSIESSPSSPEPNHLSCYFGIPSQHTFMDEAPTIPKRALSHTKKNAEILARKRSTTRISSPKNSMSMVRSSINTLAANVEVMSQQHPFGNELAQVSELAEDYGMTRDKMTVIDEEEQELISQGLFKFRAEDYMSEIQGLFISTFGEAHKPAVSPMWI